MGGFWKWLELKREAGFGLKIFVSYTGWWFGTFFFPFSWEFHHPNWRTHIFQRGRWVHVEVYEANSQPWDGLVTEVDSLLRYIIFWSWGLVTWNRSPKAPFGSNLCYPYKLYVRSYGIYQIHILYIYIYIYTLLYIYIHDWSVPFWNKLFGTNIHGANGPQKNRVKPTNDTSCRWSFQFYFYEKQ